MSGETMDAGGRALGAQRVELVRSGEVVAMATTGSRGEWSFANVAPGEYIARATVNGHVAGTRVSVVAGQSARALIVAPSVAAASPAILAPLGLFGALGVGAAVVTGIVVTAVKISAS